MLYFYWVGMARYPILVALWFQLCGFGIVRFDLCPKWHISSPLPLTTLGTKVEALWYSSCCSHEVFGFFLQISALAMWAAAVPPIVPADHPMAGITLLECTTARPICVHRTMVCSPTSCLSRTLCVGSAASGVALQSIGCVCAVLQFCVLPVSLFGLEPAMLHCASSRQSVTKHAGGGWDSPRRSASVPACWAVYQRNHHQHLLLAFIIIIIIIAVIIIIVITKHCERQGFLSPRHLTWLLVGWLSSLWSALASASASSWYFFSALYNVLHTSPHRVQLITSRITAMLIKTLKCLLHVWVFDEDCCYLLCRCMLFGKIWCGSQHFSRMKHRGGMECKRTELKS